MSLTRLHHIDPGRIEVFARPLNGQPTAIHPAGSLTPAAYAHGLDLALPQVVLASPAGFGSPLTPYHIPIEGCDECALTGAGSLAPRGP